MCILLFMTDLLRYIVPKKEFGVKHVRNTCLILGNMVNYYFKFC